MYWSYRVMKKAEDEYGITECVIREFYFNDDGSILGWTENDVRPCGEDPDELRDTLTLMLLACGKEVITEDQLSQIMTENPQEEMDTHWGTWEDDGGAII